jgi:hypothetical protein
MSVLHHSRERIYLNGRGKNFTQWKMAPHLMAPICALGRRGTRFQTFRKPSALSMGSARRAPMLHHAQRAFASRTPGVLSAQIAQEVRVRAEAIHR